MASDPGDPMTDRPPFDLLVDARLEVAEGPVWDERAGRLLWLDVLGGVVHSTDPVTGVDEPHPVGQPVGAVGLAEAGWWILALRDGFARYDPATRELRMIAAVEIDDPTTRFNDGKVDPAGRFWAGTMAFSGDRPVGTLYRLDPGGVVTPMLRDLTISNGMDWSPGGDVMYFIDTPTGGVDRLRYDGPTGDVRDRTVLFSEPSSRGYPDGMTVDAEGFLWVAFWEGGAVRRYDPSGRLDREYVMPVSQPTSCAFGGPDLHDLFVTTASEEFTPERRALEPHAGGVFHLRADVAGRLPFRLRDEGAV
jgi:sugar lactone lactonase YvrE